jgi:hypothetical protein
MDDVDECIQDIGNLFDQCLPEVLEIDFSNT